MEINPILEYIKFEEDIRMSLVDKNLVIMRHDLVCCPRNNCAKSFYLVQDGLSSRSPNERTGVCIVVGHKLLDLVDELLH